MALHRAVQRVAAGHGAASMPGLRLGFRAVARPAPLDDLVVAAAPAVASPPSVLPEHEDGRAGIDFPSFGGVGGPMELMAVPKKKVSPFSGDEVLLGPCRRGFWGGFCVLVVFLDSWL